MQKIKKFISLLPGFLMVMPALFSCSTAQTSNPLCLRVLNSEDYISDGTDETVDLLDEFKKQMSEELGQPVNIIYDTFDTMENMYNVLNTGKTKYDLICASDYMIQKLANNGLICKLDHTKVPFYDDADVTPGQYTEVGFDDVVYDGSDFGASGFVRNLLKDDVWTYNNESYSLDDYCECYMWGTLGILYNPSGAPNVSKDDFINDMTTFSSLWNKKYNKLISIKDSMRDTYAIGLIEKYRSELDSHIGDASARQKIFDRGGQDDPDAVKHINEIKDKLIELRKNIFGFEVDSGKQDIVTGKIAIDTAWSGDAVWAIDEAASAQEEDSNVPDLYYSVPDEGSNIWFDCWAMQNGANEDLAYRFLNFLSRPDSVMANYDSIGYTSAIAGDDLFDYYAETYDDTYDEVASTIDFNTYDKSELEGGEIFYVTGTDEYYIYEDGDWTLFNDMDIHDITYFFDPGNTGTYTIAVAKGGVSYREIEAQFPLDSVIDNLMIMRDYGVNNELITKMWEEVKHEPLPVWAIVLFVSEIILIGGGIAYLIIYKARDKSRRKKRRLKTA